MDPLSISASITALTGLASNIISFLYSVKNASSEQTKLRSEIVIVSGLLTALGVRLKGVKADDEGFSTIRPLRGAIDQCMESLDKLSKKIDRDKLSGVAKMGRNMTWHYGKIEMNNTMLSIERLKSSLDLALTSDVGILVQKMKVSSEMLKRDVSELKGDFKSQIIERRHKEIGDWLSPFDFKAIQQEVLHRCHPGTGKWMLESDKFRQWSGSHNETLWCPGIPGAGKTYLASIVIDYLQRQTCSEGQNVVLCLFCSFNEQGDQTAYKFMGALLKQLVQTRQDLSSVIRSMYDRRENDRRPDFRELADAFRTELERFSKIFIIVDALDETLESGDIRMTLLPELQSRPINLLVTSRHDPTIKKQFSEAQLCEIYATDEDMRSYISKRMGQERRLSRQIMSVPSLRNDIPARVVGSAKGM